jgi:hypothetical protein
VLKVGGIQLPHYEAIKKLHLPVNPQTTSAKALFLGEGWGEKNFSQKRISGS